MDFTGEDKFNGSLNTGLIYMKCTEGKLRSHNQHVRLPSAEGF
jgi:hypothetical protein